MGKTYLSNVARNAALSMGAFVVALIATNPLIGCFSPDEGVRACPGEASLDVQCAWEGPVSYDLEEVLQGGSLLFVRARMSWAPCGATPGEQTRTYQIDPNGGATKQISLLPPDTVAISGLTSDPIELAIKDTTILVRLLRSISGSVTSTTLKIGDIVDNTTGADVAPIEIDVVCGQ
jgi:hypothetical protein